MIRTEDLSCAFGSVHAMAGVSIGIGRGEFVGLVGPSGAGKSTLLRTLNGFVSPTAGRVVVAGRDVGRLSRPQLRRHRADVGMIYQQFNLVRRASALANVAAGSVSRIGALSTWLGRIPPAERRRATVALQRVGLLAQWDQRTSTLSGGQQQRVAIARTLVQDPQVVLADEPVASLDPGSSERILALLRALAHEDGRTVIVSLHQVEYARRFCDRVIAMDQGRVTIDATPDAISDAQWSALYQLTRPEPEAADGLSPAMTSGTVR